MQKRNGNLSTQKSRDSTLFLMERKIVRNFASRDDTQRTLIIKKKDEVTDVRPTPELSVNDSQSMVVAEPLEKPSRSSFIEQERQHNPERVARPRRSGRAASPKPLPTVENRRQRKECVHQHTGVRSKVDRINDEGGVVRRAPSKKEPRIFPDVPVTHAGVVRNPTFRVADRDESQSRTSISESVAATTMTILTDSKQESTQTEEVYGRHRQRKHHPRRSRSNPQRGGSTDRETRTKIERGDVVKRVHSSREASVVKEPLRRPFAQKQEDQEKSFEELWMEEWKAAHDVVKNGYADTPERDSLDGELPGSPSAAQLPVDSKPDPSKKEDKKDKKSKKKKEKEELALDIAHLPLPGLSTKKVPAMIGGDGWGGAREPCARLWVALSSLYGKFLVVLTFAFCLTEVMDNSYLPLHFQGVYLVYLYVASIVSILTIYVAILVESFPGSSKNSMESLTGKSDPEVGSVRSVGSFRMTYLSRQTTPRTSFYLRIGALVFGLGTLVFSGLEIAMHSTMNSKCVGGDLAFAHPVLQALFIFLQMHFLFVNSEVLLHKNGILAQFGLMHLVATNVSLWVRTVVWESANEWYHFLYHQHRYGHPGGAHLVGAITARIRGFASNLPDDYYDYDDTDARAASSSLNFQDTTAKAEADCNSYSPISESHVRQMVSLYECFNNNTLGRSWTASMPYLFPFLVEYKLKIELHFGLIAAVAMYVLWRSISRRPPSVREEVTLNSASTGTLDARQSSNKRRKWRVDCQGSSIGLLVGLLCLVAAIIVSIVFFVMKDNLDFRPEMFWICTGTQVAILSVCIVMNILGFLQLPKLSSHNEELSLLDKILQNVTVGGVLIFAAFGTIVGAQKIESAQHSMTLAMNLMIIIQVVMQHMFISELSVRACASRYQMAVKPGRQIVMFLLVANVALWLLDSFLTHSWSTQELHFTFYGILTWGVISRMTLPFVVFYRFHSAVVLVELWKNSYRTDDA